MSLNIYIKDEMAFVDLGAGYLLCIGTKKEVDAATDCRILRMIDEAIAISKYRCIEIWKDTKIH